MSDPSVEDVVVGALGLGDVITLPDTNLTSPARIVGLSSSTPGANPVRFIDLVDVETGDPHDSRLCLNLERHVLRHERGDVPEDQIEHKSFFG